MIVTIEKLTELYTMPKTVFGWPTPEDWVPCHPDRQLMSEVKLLIPLATGDGIAIGGLSLLLTFQPGADRDGAAVLQFCDRGNWHLGRFDFGANQTHSNMVAFSKGIADLKMMVRGSHCHPLPINRRLGVDHFKAEKGKPPAAIEVLDSPPSFRQRMRAIGAEFNVADLDLLPAPPYQGDLF